MTHSIFSLPAMSLAATDLRNGSLKLSMNCLESNTVPEVDGEMNSFIVTFLHEYIRTRLINVNLIIILYVCSHVQIILL